MSNVKVRVLGSGNAFNQNNRLNSSYLVESKEQKILIDCGFTTPLALQQNDIPCNEIDAVLITHYHGDHFAGLSAMLLALSYTSLQKKQLLIVGAEDVEDRVRELVKVLYPGSEKVFNTLDIKFQTITKSFKIGGISVEAIPMIHSVEALPYGFILDFNFKKIGFSGDTCWHAGVVDLITRVDAVFLECNLVKKVGKGHISVEELEESKLVQSKKSNIYLTHLSGASYRLAEEKDYNCIADADTYTF